MKNILIFLLLISFAGFGQETNKGTITVKKEKIDTPSVSAPQVRAILALVEKMPVYAGGNAEMMKFIQDNLNIPSRGAAFSGTCYATFIVNTDGTLSDVAILKGVSGCSVCNTEVLRVIKLLPKRWTPGMQNGVPVVVEYNLPVKII